MTTTFSKPCSLDPDKPKLLLLLSLVSRLSRRTRHTLDPLKSFGEDMIGEGGGGKATRAFGWHLHPIVLISDARPDVVFGLVGFS